ncbi:MAG TPA: hypothetical protein VKB69_16845 [Micromonosporaceae bacterium]|nr:hypothetical protein [Micromonosporaceae bacterium]
MRTGTRWIGGLASLALVAWGVVACLHAAARNQSRIRVDQARLRLDRERAHDALARWDSAVAAADPGRFVPTGDAIQRVGTWEPAFAAAATRALASGHVGFAKDSDYLEPARPPRTGEVRWADGKARTVNLISKQEARERIVAAGRARTWCPNCQALLLGDARLVTGHVQTTRGPATAPMWEFNVTLDSDPPTGAGASGRPPTGPGGERRTFKLRRLAVATPDGVAVVPPRDPRQPVSMNFYGAWADGSNLTVWLGGDPFQGCVVFYTGEAYESPSAVAVVIVPHGRCARGPTIGGPPRDPRVSVHLASPLGDRAVLDTRTGGPVPTMTG